MPTTARRPRPAAASTTPQDPPSRVTGDEVAAELRTTRRAARKTLEQHQVPVLVLSERRWLVDAIAFRRFLADLEQQARARVQQRELQADFIKPTRGRPARR